VNRERDARVASDVPELPLVGQRGEDDLVSVEADPCGRDVRSAVGVDRDDVRDGGALEQGQSGFGKPDAGHLSVLLFKAVPSERPIEPQ
jgi:hypothetical protein